MRSPKKKICHRDRNYMIYVLTFLIALTGILGISKGSPVLAAEEESTQKGSISLVCPVEGMELSLYRVAEYEESGSFTLTEQFRKYPVSLEQKSQEGWQGTADALADYIRRDGITADAVLVSGSDKIVCFTDLNRGLYLVLGQTTELQEDGKTQIYEPQTALIALPEDSQGTSEETEPYQVTAVLKFEKNDKPGKPENPEEEEMNLLIPGSKWVRIREDDVAYIMGIIYDEDGTPMYLCYGFPEPWSENPPENLEGYSQWIPLDCAHPHDQGYWVIYINAKTGERVR